MAGITVRSLDDDVKTRLRIQAVGPHRSTEEEARIILRDGVDDALDGPRDLARSIRHCSAPLSGVEPELPACASMCEPPDFPQAARDACH